MWAWAYPQPLRRPGPKTRSDVGLGLSLIFEDPRPKEKSDVCPGLFLNIEEALAKSKECCGPGPMSVP